MKTITCRLMTLVLLTFMLLLTCGAQLGIAAIPIRNDPSFPAVEVLRDFHLKSIQMYDRNLQIIYTDRNEKTHFIQPKDITGKDMIFLVQGYSGPQHYSLEWFVTSDIIFGELVGYPGRHWNLQVEKNSHKIGVPQRRIVKILPPIHGVIVNNDAELW